MDRQRAAEELRLQGNDAFATKDFDRANDLYKQSIEAFPTAKACANLAATLGKLADYQQAAVAAEQATSIDPKWAKGWWRRGVTSELRKRFTESLTFYELATELEPKNQDFRKSLRAMQQRLKVQGKTANGFDIVDQPQIGHPNPHEAPAIKAFWKARRTVGFDQPVLTLLKQYEQREVAAAERNKQKLVPTSQQWFVVGKHEWIASLQGAVADLCIHISQQARNDYNALQQRSWSSQVRFFISPPCTKTFPQTWTHSF
jgi:tetratricopeptide (TPR) repeat protein